MIKLAPFVWKDCGFDPRQMRFVSPSFVSSSVEHLISVVNSVRT